MVNKIVGIKMFIVPLAVAISLMAIVLYVKPAFDEMWTLKNNQTDIKNELEDLKKQNEKLSELSAKWESMSGERLLVEGALPKDANIDNCMAELYERASRSGVLLTGISEEKMLSLKSYACQSDNGSVVSAAGLTDSGMTEGESSSAAGTAAVQAPPSCADGVYLDVTANGTWDQIIDFFKYMGDMNRIANISAVNIGKEAGNPGEENELLSLKVGMNVFYKKESKVGSSSIITGLASGKGFEENVIKKLDSIVFSPYSAPLVSKSGERNIFK